MVLPVRYGDSSSITFTKLVGLKELLSSHKKANLDSFNPSYVSCDRGFDEHTKTKDIPTFI